MVVSREDAAAADPAPRVYVANAVDDTVSVIDSATNEVMKTIPVGNNPSSIAIAPNGRWAYVTHHEGDSVAVIDTASNTVVATVPAGPRPLWSAITPDGARLYVTNHHLDSTVTVIDTARRAIAATIPVANYPSGVAASPDGRFAYVTSQQTKTLSVIDTATNEVVKTAPTQLGAPHVTVGPNGARVYVTEDDDAGFRDGGRSTLTVLDAATFGVIAKVPVTNRPWHLALSPDGDRVYVGNNNCCGNSEHSITAIDARNHQVLAVVPVGPVPSGLAVTPDNARVYVANAGSLTDPSSDTVWVVDTASFEVVAKIKVGLHPGGIAILANVPNVPGGNTPPTITSAAFASDSRVACGADNATLRVRFDDPDAGQAHTATVRWGDGSGPRDLGQVTNPFDVRHTYARAGAYTATVTVSDGAADSAPAEARVTVNYTNDGILRPINPDGTSVFGRNSVIPVKLQIQDCDGSYPADLAPTVRVKKVTADPPTEAINEAVGVGNANTGNVMRFDAASNQYVFNLSARSLDDPNATYRAVVTIERTHQVIESAPFGIRERR